MTFHEESALEKTCGHRRKIPYENTEDVYLIPKSTDWMAAQYVIVERLADHTGFSEEAVAEYRVSCDLRKDVAADFHATGG